MKNNTEKFLDFANEEINNTLYLKQEEEKFFNMVERIVKNKF